LNKKHDQSDKMTSTESL